ncbi:hypothetical protein SDJN03_04617, partial [Cucurbita argyrosperma subsp. sororia]
MNGFNYAGELLRNLSLLLFSSGGGAVLRCGEDWAGKEASLKLNNAADGMRMAQTRQWLCHTISLILACILSSFESKAPEPRSPTNLAIF